ncbi:agmatine deiminase [Vibrio sp. CK2-1]|uniref:agmatine deiminase n=1 Tax=Vibrio sp. CK2-1 TaxID=2912249 RepID=UPI001F028F1C|nr:agmatine deiminase [Vibrio sp. CK2-1]MCF7354209.1 agmatine deiminase [Vibrio sp. CK2-1]
MLTIPKNDGFYMPGEHEPQEEVWLGWPERTDTWPWGAKPAQMAFANVANTIVEFTKVTVCVSAQQYDNARQQLNNNVRVLEMSMNDSWFRDTGPTYLVNGQGERRGVDWQFNAWGGLLDGLYFPWDKDDAVAGKITNSYRDSIYRAPFVLEGGSIHSDGEGTIYTTKECLLHPSRNPDLSQDQIEDYLKQFLGAEKVIWLELGLYADDDTNGHVDNIMHVARPGEIVLSWTEDKNDPQYAISQHALELLQSSTDAKGRNIEVHKLTLPKPLHIAPSEGLGFDACEGMVRETGTRMAASYANFLITNGLVLFPMLCEQSDTQAQRELQAIFPEHKIVGIPARDILLGGGNIHCITQQIPLI